MHKLKQVVKYSKIIHRLQETPRLPCLQQFSGCAPQEGKEEQKSELNTEVYGHDLTAGQLRPGSLSFSCLYSAEAVSEKHSRKNTANGWALLQWNKEES